jgi:hypothetical protein
MFLCSMWSTTGMHPTLRYIAMSPKHTLVNVCRHNQLHVLCCVCVCVCVCVCACMCVHSLNALLTCVRRSTRAICKSRVVNRSVRPCRSTSSVQVRACVWACR